jgi:electron transfer flavoprotein beta subunit
MTIGVCIKWVDQRPEVNVLTGAVSAGDQRFGGVSAADRAALEWALRCGEAWDTKVLVVTLGPAGADAELREALAAGATRAVRIDADPQAPSHIVAAALAAELSDCHTVWCGDYSSDRGSGSVPAFLAARLGAAQALGLVHLEPHPGPGHVRAVRRLDGGRRERLEVSGRSVLSVEGSTAQLRRASLAAALGAGAFTISVVPGPDLGEHPRHPTRPYRPRARALPAPDGATALDRIRALTAAHEGSDTHGELVELDPAAAADRIVAALVEWGYLDPSVVREGAGTAP